MHVWIRITVQANEIIIKVSFRVLRHFTHKASVTSLNAEANVHSADWLLSIFVKELAPPRPTYAVNKVSACCSAEGL